jgi:transcriptional regulator with XRE-family HTH domain
MATNDLPPTTNDSPNALAVYLRTKRKALGLTPSQAVRLTNGEVSRSEVVLIERGDWPRPPIELLRGFAVAYRVPFIEVLLQAGRLTVADIIKWGGSSEHNQLVSQYFERYAAAERNE